MKIGFFHIDSFKAELNHKLVGIVLTRDPIVALKAQRFQPIPVVSDDSEHGRRLESKVNTDDFDVGAMENQQVSRFIHQTIVFLEFKKVFFKKRKQLTEMDAFEARANDFDQSG